MSTMQQLKNFIRHGMTGWDGKALLSEPSKLTLLLCRKASPGE